MRCHDRAERGITGHGVPSIPAARERASRAIRPTYARWRSMACRMASLLATGSESTSKETHTCPARDRQHVCVEVPVADDEVTKPAAVEIAAPGGQGQQGRVDEQFLESVTDVAGGNVDADPLLHSDVLTAANGDIPNRAGDREHVDEERPEVGATCTC